MTDERMSQPPERAESSDERSNDAPTVESPESEVDPDRVPDADDTGGPVPEALDLAAHDFYLNRELSELQFQKRVLFEAEDDRNPLLERVKFLAIFTRNMDEFFMKRVGGLKQQIDAGVTELTADGRSPEQQHTEILREARSMVERQAECYHDAVRPLLAESGIEIVDHDDVADTAQTALRDYFEANVLPTLTPLTFDPAHPFPFISNLSLSLAVLTRDDAEDDDLKFSRVKIPKNRPRLVPVEDVVGEHGRRGESGEHNRHDESGERDESDDTTEPASATDQREGADAVDAAGATRFVLLEQVIEANLDLLFPNVEVVGTSTFRVTRNAEVRRNEEVAEGLIEMIEDVLRQRRFATVVRLEVADDMPPEVRELLIEQLDVDESEVYDLPEPLDFRDFVDLTDLERPDLKLDPWTPRMHPRFAGLELGEAGGADDLFAEIRRDDILVHHPYHSFTNTVQTFLDAAASDPDVLAIKAAIYRTASDSQVIESLIEAAKNGKQVAVMVELKARFDEENNLRWVKRLEEEGIHVAYGTIGLKTHSKTALVVREETDGVQLYSHVATGNYHSETAKTYVDLGMLTADHDIGQDLVRLFNYFTGHSRHEDYRKLLVAPENMRDQFTRLIRREAEHARQGKPARIVAKMNSLEDPEIVEELYRASMAGVEMDLLVRGICRLRPGIEGVSDTIRVHSVVGRFLEHSRVFYFENAHGESASEDEAASDPASDGAAATTGAHDGEYYIGSADWMTRNLDRRVEAVAPVEDPALQAELQTILDIMLSDNRKRWTMASDGSYAQARPAEDEPVRNTHERLMARARKSIDEVEATDADVAERRTPSVDLDDVFTDGRQ
jgi:polyphosphate kinase